MTTEAAPRTPLYTGRAPVRPGTIIELTPGAPTFDTIANYARGEGRETPDGLDLEGLSCMMGDLGVEISGHVVDRSVRYNKVYTWGHSDRHGFLYGKVRRLKPADPYRQDFHIVETWTMQPDEAGQLQKLDLIGYERLTTEELKQRFDEADKSGAPVQDMQLADLEAEPAPGSYISRAVHQTPDMKPGKVVEEIDAQRRRLNLPGLQGFTWLDNRQSHISGKENLAEQYRIIDDVVQITRNKYGALNPPKRTFLIEAKSEEGTHYREVSLEELERRLKGLLTSFEAHQPRFIFISQAEVTEPDKHYPYSMYAGALALRYGDLVITPQEAAKKPEQVAMVAALKADPAGIYPQAKSLQELVIEKGEDKVFKLASDLRDMYVNDIRRLNMSEIDILARSISWALEAIVACKVAGIDIFAGDELARSVMEQIVDTRLGEQFESEIMKQSQKVVNGDYIKVGHEIKQEQHVESEIHLNTDLIKKLPPFISKQVIDILALHEDGRPKLLGPLSQSQKARIARLLRFTVGN
jgi:hypothetical protein